MTWTCGSHVLGSCWLDYRPWIIGTYLAVPRPERSNPAVTRVEAEAMTKREEPWSVEDDWVAEEERWFREEGRVYYPWARRVPRWAVPAGAVVLTALVLLGLGVVWVAVPRWTVPAASEADLHDVPPEARWQAQDSRRKLRNDARTTLLQGLGGLAVLVGATAALRQVGVASQGQVTERFTRAIDQLGHESLDVRLGGIYALERITGDSEQDRSTIAEVLTAFVRGHAPWPPSRPGQPPEDLPVEDIAPLQRWAPDVQTALTVLGRREPTNGLDLDLRHTDLRGANLRRAVLEQAVLEGARLQRANLSLALLHAAHLENAQLQGALLYGARMRSAWLDGAQLQGAHLHGAKLYLTDLDRAQLQGAVYDPGTAWPPYFDPKAAGATLHQG
jgi:Pentapeptide repeats (8 copies)